MKVADNEEGEEKDEDEGAREELVEAGEGESEKKTNEMRGREGRMKKERQRGR